MALTKVPSNLDATIATTQSQADNSTNIATTAYVDLAISNLSDSAPAALNTLNEIAAALGDDANYASTTTAAIAGKLPLAGGTMTGNLTVNAIVDADNYTINGGQGTDGQVLTSTGSGVAWESIPAGTTINNNADNRIITGSGTADTLEGEANLTFDGSTLAVTGTATMDGLVVGSATSQNSVFDTVFGSGDANEGIVIVPSTTGKGWVGFNNGNNANIPAQLTYNFSSSLMELYSSGSLNMQTGAASRLNIASNGDIFFYEDTGTTAKLFWDASEERLGLTGSDYQFYIQQGSNQPWYHRAVSDGSYRIHLNGTGDILATTSTGINVTGAVNSTGEMRITNPSATSQLYLYGATGQKANIILNEYGVRAWHVGAGTYTSGKFSISDGSTERLVIDASGNVGIGLTNPSTNVQIWGTDPVLRVSDDGSIGYSSLQLLQGNTASEGTDLFYDSATGDTHLNTLYPANIKFGTAVGGLTNTSTNVRMTIGSSGGITISNSPANTGEGLGQPDMSKTTEGGIHFTSGGTQTSKGITWEAGGSGETQAGIVCHNNDANGTHLGFFTTYSYGAGPLCQMKLDQYGSLVLGASIDVTTVNSPSQHNAIYIEAGDVVVDATNGDLHMSDLLPGYNRGDYTCLKATGSNLYFAVNGSYVSYINGSGTYNISDSRLKENITTLTGSLEKIKQLRGVNFTWVDTESRGSDTHLGFIAQEVEPYFPEAVGDGGLPNPNDENDEPYKNVSYATLVPALVEAIKELNTKLEAAEARIETLENA
jgi:hypothetical protein